MTPEERQGIEELLAKMDGTEVAYAWLKLQLKHNDWDNSIERMGGGPKARNAYMNPIFDVQCSVTAFDMHAQLTGDGRERGLWVWLTDESKARAGRYDTWAEGALAEFCRLAGLEQAGIERFRLAMARDSFKNVANTKVHEAALLEWPAVKKMYDVIGKELAKQCPAPKKKKSTASRTTSKTRKSAASSSKRS